MPLGESKLHFLIRRCLLEPALATALKSPLGGSLESALVALGHKYPYSLPGRGTIQRQMFIHRKKTGLTATLSTGAKLTLPPILEAYSLYLHGCLCAEQGTTMLLKGFLREGDVFFDVGAHLGFYTFLAASLCGASGRVYAFEPQAQYAEYLDRSRRLNGYDWVRIESAAATDTNGATITLYGSKDPGNTGVASVFAHEWVDQAARYVVPTVCLDEVVRREGITRVNAVKMDIEGAEMIALRGMAETLQRNPPDLIVIELLAPSYRFANIENGTELTPHADAAKPMELGRFLASYGYQPWRINAGGRLASACSVAELGKVGAEPNVAFVRPILRGNRPDLFAVQ